MKRLKKAFGIYGVVLLIAMLSVISVIFILLTQFSDTSFRNDGLVTVRAQENGYCGGYDFVACSDGQICLFVDDHPLSAGKCYDKEEYDELQSASDGDTR